MGTVDEVETVETVERVDETDGAGGAVQLSDEEIYRKVREIIALKRRNGEDENGAPEMGSLSFYVTLMNMKEQAKGMQVGMANVHLDMVRKLTNLELGKIRACGEDVFATGSISDHVQMMVSKVGSDLKSMKFGELKEEYINEITRMTTNEITRGAGTSNERGESSMPHPSNPVGKLRKTSMETDPLNFSPGVPGRMTGEVLTYKCSECGIVKEGLLRCGMCKSVYYCSAEHQKSHWKHHKVFCYQLTHVKKGVKKESKKLFKKEKKDLPVECTQKSERNALEHGVSTSNQKLEQSQNKVSQLEKEIKRLERKLAKKKQEAYYTGTMIGFKKAGFEGSEGIDIKEPDQLANEYMLIQKELDLKEDELKSAQGEVSVLQIAALENESMLMQKELKVKEDELKKMEEELRVLRDKGK